jgi:hypothetical protein
MANTYDPEKDRIARRQQLASVQQPAAYVPQYESQIQAAAQAYADRKPFSYDVNADALYQQYKDQYARNGRLAMQDTMGQAAAMTGGYGNSYAASAGNQAYQAYMGRLNEAVPQLYQLAMSKYQMDDELAAKKYSMYAAEDERQYGRWNDKYSRWQNAMQLAESGDQYDRSLAENQRQHDLDLAEKQREFDISASLNQDKYLSSIDPNYVPYTYTPATPTEETPDADGSKSKIGTWMQKVADAGQAAANNAVYEKIKAGIQSRDQFKKNGGTDAQYNEYVKGYIMDNYHKGKMTEDQAATLLAAYGIHE